MSPEKFSNNMQMAIHEISRNEKDPTLMPVKFTIVDFETSGNGTQMSKEVALEGGKTLLGKPIVARYHETNDYDVQDDNFGGHELVKRRNRYGEEVLAQNTVPIGVFTTEGYLETMEVNGVTKEVMVAEGNLWYYKFQDACELLYEWHQRGVNINTSCEYLYFNYSQIDGVTHHLSPIIFNAHTILASESRGNIDEVAPSYESSKVLSLNELNKFANLVTQAYNKNVEEANNITKEVDELPEDIKKVDEETLEKANEQVHEIDENATDANADVNPETQETNGAETDEKVEEKTDEKVEESTKEKTEEVVEEKVEETPVEEKSEEAKEETVESLKAELATQAKAHEDEMTAMLGKVKEATDLTLSLQSRVKELEAIEAQFNEHVLNDKVKAQFNEFKPKFDAVGATEKFESEEVQDLVKLSVHATEEGRNALFQLQSLIIDSINLSTHAKPVQTESGLTGLQAFHRKDYGKELESHKSGLDSFDREFMRD